MKRYLFLTCSLCLLAGCQTWTPSLADKLPWSSRKPKVQESAYTAPTRIVAIWSDAVYSEPGRRPVRGVGGRLYFHNDKNEPVPVEGQLVVYGYDDSEITPAQTPSRKFVYTPEQFRERWSPTDLGASYSIWLPWDEVGGYKRTVTLLPVFTAANGGIVMGTQSISVLPGKAAAAPEMTKKGHFTTSPPVQVSAVQPAGYEQPAAGPQQYAAPASGEVPVDPATWQMRTATIPLPPVTAQRMIQEEAATRAAAASVTPATGTPFQAYPVAAPSAGNTPAGSTGSGSTEPTPATRFERPRYQVPGGASSLPSRGPAASLPGHAAPLPGPPSRH